MRFKDIKRALAGKDAQARARQELERGVDAVLSGDSEKAQKHLKRSDKLNKLINK